MLESVLITFIIAKIKGFRIKPLFRTWYVYPFFAAACVSVVLQILLVTGHTAVIEYGKYAGIIVIASFLPVIIAYRKAFTPPGIIVGILFAILGALLNNIVIRANSGKMPVFPSVSGLFGADISSLMGYKNLHVMGNSSTRLKLLSDIIDTGYVVYSIGDIFMFVLPAVVVYSAIRYSNASARNYK